MPGGKYNADRLPVSRVAAFDSFLELGKRLPRADDHGDIAAFPAFERPSIQPSIEIEHHAVGIGGTALYRCEHGALTPHALEHRIEIRLRDLGRRTLDRHRLR